MIFIFNNLFIEDLLSKKFVQKLSHVVLLNKLIHLFELDIFLIEALLIQD